MRAGIAGTAGVRSGIAAGAGVRAGIAAGAGVRAGIASLASRGSRSKINDAKQESCNYSDADMKEAYRIS